MTDEQAADWHYKMVSCLGISNLDSDINGIKLDMHIKAIYEQGRADNRELLQQALDALEFPHDSEWSNKAKAIEALQHALVQPEQEWRGLTDLEIARIYTAWDKTNGVSFADFARAIEFKLRCKNDRQPDSR
jgi:hypothetical protein